MLCSAVLYRFISSYVLVRESSSGMNERVGECVNGIISICPGKLIPNSSFVRDVVNGPLAIAT